MQVTQDVTLNFVEDSKSSVTRIFKIQKKTYNDILYLHSLLPGSFM